MQIFFAISIKKSIKIYAKYGQEERSRMLRKAHKDDEQMEEKRTSIHSFNDECDEANAKNPYSLCTTPTPSHHQCDLFSCVCVFLLPDHYFKLRRLHSKPPLTLVLLLWLVLFHLNKNKMSRSRSGSFDASFSVRGRTIAKSKRDRENSEGRQK